jgi:hypothetical protein
MSSFPERWEAARNVYLEQRDRYYSSFSEEDFEKANAAFRNWLATTRIFVRETRPLRTIKDILERR